MNFVKFLRTPFFTKHLRWLLPSIVSIVDFEKASTGWGNVVDAKLSKTLKFGLNEMNLNVLASVL